MFAYILTNDRLTTLYIGVTNDLEGRLWQHQNGEGSRFADHYNLKRLIYYEVYPYAAAAIARESQLKGWTRAKKDKLIATINPEWRDLAAELFGDKSPAARRDSSTARCAAFARQRSAQNDCREGGGSC